MHLNRKPSARLRDWSTWMFFIKKGQLGLSLLQLAVYHWNMERKGGNLGAPRALREPLSRMAFNHPLTKSVLELMVNP